MKYKTFDGMSWPDPTTFDELEWRLRYGGPVSRSDAYAAASIVGAYQALIGKTIKRREYIVRKIRETTQ